MRSANEHRLAFVGHLALAFLLALGTWYMVVGSAQVEGQVEVRLEYRGLPEGLLVREGMANRVAVRLRGPGELLRGLQSRELVYTVDLSGVTRGANVLPVEVARLGDFKAYEVVEVSPSRLVLEVDALMERVVPLQADLVPLPEELPVRVDNVLLEPSFVTISGPESLVRGVDALSVSYDPAQNMGEGTRAVNVAINAPDQVVVSPPVTTIRYTVSRKAEQITLQRVVQMDTDERGAYVAEPSRVTVTVEAPEGRSGDAAYLAAVRVVVRPPADPATDVSGGTPVLVMLPAGARLVEVAPSHVNIRPRSK